MVRKLTFEEVKIEFIKRGFKLLTDKYINSRTKMKYRCSCGNISEITFDNMKNKGHTCKKCASKRGGIKQSIPFKEVQKTFRDNGCELLETSYINCDTLLKYRCKCGNFSSITYYNIKNGSHCQACGNIKIGNKLRTKFLKVQKKFEKHGCKLLETEYKNTNTPLKYTCSCGNNSYITFSNLKSGHLCNQCIRERTRQTNLRKYGCINYTQTDECKERIKQTNLQKYGVEHVMHVPEIYEKQQMSAFKYKSFTMPSGKEVKLQGYEPVVLQKLLTKYNEDEITINKGEIPKIMYILNGRQHRYYPDFYIKKDNLIIEVKSLYTYRKNIVRNMLKILATRQLNFKTELHIVEPKIKTIIL